MAQTEEPVLRPALIALGWRAIPREDQAGEWEYSKEYPAPHGDTYHLFAREVASELRLHLAYLLEAGTLQLVSAALKPDQLPDDIREAAEADIAASCGTIQNR